MTPEEIETIRWGGNGSGILSPSSKGECSGYYKGETMTTEEIKKLTDDDLMLELAKRIVPKPWRHTTEKSCDNRLPRARVCVKCACIFTSFNDLNIEKDCEYPDVWCCHAEAAFAARNWMLKTNLIYKWEGIVAKPKTGSMHEIDYQAVIDASPRRWIEAAIIVIEEQSHETQSK